jgi:hypothetical protein
LGFSPWRIMPFECSTWSLLYKCDTKAELILMPESAQKSLNSLTVNWVPLSVIILLGMLNMYKIYLMNSTALATVIEASDFTLIHFVNLSNATKICVNPPLAFLKGPTKSSPHVEKCQVIGMVCSWWSDEQKTNNLHTDGLGSQRQTQQWAKRTLAYMACPRET